MLNDFSLLPPKVVDQLKQLGIFNTAQLREKGALSVFLQLQMCHRGLTRAILWRLYAIEWNMSLSDISSEIKQNLSYLLKQTAPIAIFPEQIIMEGWMRCALKEAKRAALMGEIPVGAVIVYQDQVIASGYNQMQKQCCVLYHAEMTAIEKASKILDNHRLLGCDLYVTVEPCMMCVGAILQARIRRVIYGALEAKTGMVVSVDQSIYQHTNHHTTFLGGILTEECRQLMRGFFQAKRNTLDHCASEKKI